MKEPLAPFNVNQQTLMRVVDKACQEVAEQIKEQATRCSLAGETFEPDMETAGWMNIIAAYGILYNRAIEAGWIDDLVMEKEVTFEDKPDG